MSTLRILPFSFLIFLFAVVLMSSGCSKKEADDSTTTTATESDPKPEPNRQSASFSPPEESLANVGELDSPKMEPVSEKSTEDAPTEGAPTESVSNDPPPGGDEGVSPNFLPETATAPTERESLKLDLVDATPYLDQGGTYWDAIYIGAHHVGYQSTKFSFREVEGVPLRCVEIRNQIQVIRMGRPVVIESAVRSFEKYSGEMVGSQSITRQGDWIIEHTAKVVANQLEGITLLGEQTEKQALPWKSGTGGYAAIQISLLKNNMLDQEERRISFYDPANRVPVDAVLAAQAIEKIDLPDGRKMNLRKIDAILQYANSPIPFKFWVDAVGTIVCMESLFIGEEKLVSFRTDEKTAKKTALPSTLPDVGKMPMIPLNTVLPNINDRTSLSFRIQRRNTGSTSLPKEIGSLFPQTAFQEVKTVSADCVEITVRSAKGIGPNIAKLPTQPDADVPTADDLGSNMWINPEDPTIQECAALAVPPTGSDWEKAVALERYVYDKMVPQYGSGGFAAASEVLKTLRGDCTEYGFLLAALARAQKIPARIAVGFVYTELNIPDTPQKGALGFHLWNEMYIDGHWIPMDATVGVGGANAARIKIADSNLGSKSFVSLASRILELAGNLHVEVIP